MSTQSRELSGIGRVPPQLAIGIALVATVWPLAWFGPTPFSSYTFFPLWLGYILTVDGLTAIRSGTSLLSRSRGRFALLFAFSIPLWWVFEFANRFLQNWHYQLPRDYSTLTYALLCSIAFSTVMPAIFVTAELWRTLPFFQREVRWLRIAPSRTGLLAIAALGLLMFAGSLAFPKLLFPLVWIGGFLLVDPINRLTGGRSIAGQVARGRWDTVLVLFAAGLTCGFFWEMWNVLSMPKWTYEVPYVDFLKVFEMPILGYGGYLPFALEIYAAYHLLHTVLFRARDSYLTFDARRD
ncbi:MAG TPA: hypothetical protein VD789_03480 [Thermomicrobiales bacterium]|nr:hypothetical protein [Thermomicrobiales bacterium]